MFESIFYEAAQRRAQQAALDTYKATLEYQKVRRDNPTMIDTSYVDFSNPESVYGMQPMMMNQCYPGNPPYPNMAIPNAGMQPVMMNQGYPGNPYPPYPNMVNPNAGMPPVMMNQGYPGNPYPNMAIPNANNTQTVILNPCGTFNPYANPNLINQNPGYNPEQYMSSSYGGGGSCYGIIRDDIDTSFMNYALDGDDKSTVVKVIQGPPKPVDRGKGYMEKLLANDFEVFVYRGSEKVSPQPKKEEQEVEAQRSDGPQFEVVLKPKPHPPMTPYTIEELDPQASQLKNKKEVEAQRSEGPQFEVVLKPKPHPPMTPYTMEEIDPQGYQLRTIPETPLNWSKEDNEELEKLVDDLAVYDKAMAHIAYNVPYLDGCTREDWIYIKRYFQGRLEDFRTRELLNPNLDYRAKYRYRRLPATYVEDNGDVMPDLSEPVHIPIKQTLPNGEVVYDYDRGRSGLTEEEWDIFLDRAYGEMLDGAEKLLAIDLMRLNQHLIQHQVPKEEDDDYNPYDPMSVRIHNMKAEQRSYMVNKAFFQHVFRYRLTPEEFDNWWYGIKPTSTNGKNKQFDQIQARKIWARQMSEAHYNKLLTFQPYDKNAVRNWMNQRALDAINAYTNGTVTKDMSLADFMRNLRYLDTRNHELNLEEQRFTNRQKMFDNMTHTTFMKSLYEYMNSPEYDNSNPQADYKSQCGPIDPSFGLPSNYVDLTNCPFAEERRKRFFHHCQTSKGNIRLSPVYK